MMIECGGVLGGTGEIDDRIVSAEPTIVEEDRMMRADTGMTEFMWEWAVIATDETGGDGAETR